MEKAPFTFTFQRGIALTPSWNSRPVGLMKVADPSGKYGGLVWTVAATCICQRWL